MRTFSLRRHKTGKVEIALTLDDLHAMAERGQLDRADEIREDGHRTWHKVRKVQGLEFAPEPTLLVEPEEPESFDLSAFAEAPSMPTITDDHEDKSFELKAETSDEPVIESPVVQEAAPVQMPVEVERHEPAQSPSGVTCQVAWPDGRIDGPFSPDHVKELLEDGLVTLDCMVLIEGQPAWIPIAELPVSTGAVEAERNLYVYWVDGRQDGPFALGLIRELLEDGLVDHTCQFMVEGSDTWQDAASVGIETHGVPG